MPAGRPKSAVDLSQTLVSVAMAVPHSAIPGWGGCVVGMPTPRDLQEGCGRERLRGRKQENARSSIPPRAERQSWRTPEGRRLAGLRVMCRSNVEAAIERLTQLIQSKDEHIALQSIQFAFLYGFGKPMEGRDVATGVDAGEASGSSKSPSRRLSAASCSRARTCCC
jgi:hypothetical protein